MSKAPLKEQRDSAVFFIGLFRFAGFGLLGLGFLCLLFSLGQQFLSQGESDLESEKQRLLSLVRGAFEVTVSEISEVTAQAQIEQMPEVAPEPFEFLEVDESLGDPGFPPKGERLGVLKGLIFYERQRRFAQVEVEVVLWGKDVYLAGAGMCEAVQSRHVLLKPCIFRDRILTLGKGRSGYETQLVQTLNLFVDYAFTPFKRFATSDYQCSGTESFRMSIQFLERKREGYITLRMPYSDSETAALSDLLDKQGIPCTGLDVFFQPEEVVRLVEVIDGAKNS